MHTFRTIQHSNVQIDLGAIDRNCTVIRDHIGNHCNICAVVKADGYGLGAVRVASHLAQTAKMLAVYNPDEAGELLAAGIMTPILILAPVHSVDRFHPIYRGLASGSVHLVVHGKEHLESLLTLANRYGVTLNVQVKIDTGLHRGGCELSEATTIIEKIQQDHRFRLTGVFTHFISAVNDETLTRLQHDRLDQVIHSLSTPLSTNCIVHEANTAATFQWNWTHRTMVRVGLAWTGNAPHGVTTLDGVNPVASWRTRLVHVKHVGVGERVGYSGRWTAKRPSRIGIVPVGYAAGYPMGVGEEGERRGAFVKVCDEQFKISFGDAPVIGCVCMDQIAIDLSDIPDRGVGCGIELISTDNESQATLERIAEVAGVVPHAIISRISPKVHKTYLSPSVDVVTPTQQTQTA